MSMNILIGNINYEIAAMALAIPLVFVFFFFKFLDKPTQMRFALTMQGIYVYLFLRPYFRDANAKTLDGLQAELLREQIRSKREMQKTTAALIMIPLLGSYLIYLNSSQIKSQIVSTLVLFLIIYLVFFVWVRWTGDNLEDEITAKIVKKIDKIKLNECK